MAAFTYIATNSAGKKVKGVAEADTERQVRQQLRDQGLFPLEVYSVKRKQRSKTKGKHGNKISAASLALITRQMSTLLGASMPLDEVLSSVAQQASKDRIKSILLGVRAKVLEGHSLADAMADFPQAFPLLYRTTVASGERSGKLDRVLDRLATYTEKQHRIRQKVMQALLYPALMTVVSIGVIIFLLMYVVPKIIAVFSQTNQVLPLATIVLISISNFVKHDGIYVLIGLVVLAFVFRRFLKRKKFRYSYHSFLLKLPVLGGTIRVVNCARFARTFGILNAATVPVLDAMRASAQLIVPLPIRESVESAIERIREGAPIHSALQSTGYFPPMLIHMIASGEQSGQLDAMLEKAADNQEQDVEAMIQSALTLFEPVMILVMGAIVLFIVLAIMLPIFSLDQYTG